VLQTSAIQDKVRTLNQIVQTLFNKQAPFNPSKQCAQKSILTPEIRRIRRERDVAKCRFEHNQNSQHHSFYNALRNQVKQLLRSAKTRRTHHLFGSHVPSKRLRRNLGIIGFKKSRSTIPGPSNISLDQLMASFLNIPPYNVAYLASSDVTSEPRTPLFDVSVFIRHSATFLCNHHLGPWNRWHHT